MKLMLYKLAYHSRTYVFKTEKRAAEFTSRTTLRVIFFCRADCKQLDSGAEWWERSSSLSFRRPWIRRQLEVVWSRYVF